MMLQSRFRLMCMLKRNEHESEVKSTFCSRHIFPPDGENCMDAFLLLLIQQSRGVHEKTKKKTTQKTTCVVTFFFFLLSPMKNFMIFCFVYVSTSRQDCFDKKKLFIHSRNVEEKREMPFYSRVSLKIG